MIKKNANKIVIVFLILCMLIMPINSYAEEALLDSTNAVNTELSNAIIVFAKNSSELNDAEIHRLDIIMAGLDKAGKYLVVGSADSATGTEEINTNLATERANVVKELMNKNGFNNVETTIQIDALKDQSITRCAIIKIG